MASQTKQTNLLKNYLRERFGIKSKIKTEFYTGGSSMRITYTLGCTKEPVEKIVNRLTAGHFDGMRDIYEYSHSGEKGLLISGERLDTHSYVFLTREIPESVLFQLAKAISKKIKFADIPECQEFEDLYTRYPALFLGHWTWRDYVREIAESLNFATQNEEDITNVVLVKHEGRCQYRFTYEIAGVKYDTSVFKENIKTKLKKASQAEKNEIKLVDYSERACVIYGNSYEIKDELQKLGGRFNRNLKEGSGWVFPISKKDELANLIIQYHSQTV